MTSMNRTPAWALIEDAMKRLNLSYRQAEARGDIAKGTLGQYKNDEIKTLVPRAVKAISTVLEIPLEDLVEAVLRTIGIEPRSVPSIDDLVLADDSISELGKRQILALIAKQRELSAIPKLSDDELTVRLEGRPSAAEPPREDRGEDNGGNT